MKKSNSRNPRKATRSPRAVRVVPPRRRRRQNPAPRPGSVRIIPYAPVRDQVNTLFDQVVRIVKRATEFFNLAGDLVFVRQGRGLSYVTTQNLNGYLSSHLEIQYLSIRDGVPRPTRYALLSRDLAPAFLTSPRVLGQFPGLNLYTRVPVFDRTWRLVATPGYHPASEIYYDGERVPPARKTPHLDRLLEGFCWQSDADRVNYLGLLLTAVTMLHWIGRHPLAIFNSNIPRLGKTLLARILALLVDGTCRTTSFIQNDEEFERQLSTYMDTGERVITVDNARHAKRQIEVSSGVLERCVTDMVLSFRRLGTNTVMRQPNDVIFCITMNAARLSVDLRHRGLPINLYWPGNVRGRTFDIAEPETFVLEHRCDLIAELLGMVRRWVRAGRPIPDGAATHSVSQVWAGTIDGILRTNGYHGFLSNFDESERAFDADYPALVEVSAAFFSAPAAIATAWGQKIADQGLWSDRLRDERGEPKSDQAKATIVGTLFSSHAGATFTVDGRSYRLRRAPETESASHESPTYWFERVEEQEQR